MSDKRIVTLEQLVCAVQDRSRSDQEAVSMLRQIFSSRLLRPRRSRREMPRGLMH